MRERREGRPAVVGRRTQTTSIRWSRAVAGALFAAIVLLGLQSVDATPAFADHLMCEEARAERTLRVHIGHDLESAGVTRPRVEAALGTWNAVFVEETGWPAFEVYDGDWWNADVIVISEGSRTWVESRCVNPYFAVVRLGWADSWRNADVLEHELGHALGFADHVYPGQDREGYVNATSCSTSYLGVMDYCSGPQTWFQYWDRVMVRDYRR